MNVSATSTGNNPTVYSYNLNATSLSNQRIMVKVYKSSGVDATTCYNTNDFPTRLVTLRVYVVSKLGKDTVTVSDDTFEKSSY